MSKESVALKVKTESGEFIYDGVEVLNQVLLMERVEREWLGRRLVDTSQLRDILGVEYLYTMRKRFLVPSFLKFYGKMPFLYFLCVLLFSKKLRDYVILLEVPYSIRKEFARMLYYCLIIKKSYEDGHRSERDKGLLYSKLLYLETGLNEEFNEEFKRILKASGNSYEKLIKRFLKNHSLNHIEVFLKDVKDVKIKVIGKEYGEKHRE